MALKYTYKVKQIAAMPRTGRALDALSGGVVTSSAVSTSGSGSTPGSATDHSQLTGIVSTADKYSGNAKDIHLTANDADALKRISSIEIIESTDFVTLPSDSNVYSALMTDWKIYKAIEDNLVSLDGMFLRKDIPDT
ncbi:hypothetical protein, partial [Parabacteroides sp. AM08-6]|uniref:hypothetical protein n=1 Tax=Parabacteroides sp. AM08-6 TaxID=2292053 RepID=UPI000FF181D3